MKSVSKKTKNSYPHDLKNILHALENCRIFESEKLSRWANGTKISKWNILGCQQRQLHNITTIYTTFIHS